MLKKMSLIFLSFVTLLFFCKKLPVIYAESPNNIVTLSIGAGGVIAGDTVDVSVNIGNHDNISVCVIELKIYYNSLYFTPQARISGFASDTDVNLYDHSNRIRVVWENLSNAPVTENNIVTVRFAVSDNTPGGAYPITIECIEFYDLSIPPKNIDHTLVNSDVIVVDVDAVKNHLLKKTVLTGLAADAANTTGADDITVVDLLTIKEKGL